LSVTQLKKVWLWDKWPGRWGPDAGIDLVAQAKDGTLWAIQAKAYGPDNAVTKKDMDSFLSESARAEFHHRLLIATTRHVSAAAIRASKAAEKPVSTLLRHDLERREGLLWPATFTAWSTGRFPKPKLKRPRPHQQKALRLALKKLKDHDRGQLILACGTGKTLTALWLHERLPSSRTLVLVPSLSLLGQTLQEWIANAKSPFAVLPVCSDDTVRRADHDVLMASTLELGYPSTTDPEAVRAFLKRGGPKVVFSTYQSSHVIADALKDTKVRFDLVIADEAHRCAGVVLSEFSTALHDNKIPARKRVFMTATPRYYTGRVLKKAKQADLEVASMNDESIFGPVFYRLNFSEAIEKNLLTDYRVVIVGIDDARYRRYVEQKSIVAVGGKETTDARALAAHIGLAKAMGTYDLQRVISFHGRVSGATKFAQTFPVVTDWMPRRERPSGKIWAEAVSGEMSSGERKTRLDRLRAVTTGNRDLLSNVRCLGEGIDVPMLDGIAFIDPRYSQIDIVQSVGRAIRKRKGKAISTVMVPVFVDQNVDGEDAFDASAYRVIASVLRALRDHDAVLAEELDEARRDLGAETKKKVSVPKKIVLDLPRGVDTAFSTAINTKIIRLTTESWDEYYGTLRRYHQDHGHVLVPKGYVTSSGLRLWQWLGWVRGSRRKGTLSQSRIKRLEAIPGWTWSPHDVLWWKGYSALKAYVELHGHADVPTKYKTKTGFRLGGWVGEQRQYKNLQKDRCDLLNALPGFRWPALDMRWEEGFGHLVEYQRTYGHCSVPGDFKISSGFRLGQWVSVQRTNWNRGKLRQSRIKRLKAVPGWDWTEITFQKWERNFQRLVNYAKEHGHAQVPVSFVTDDGFPLGTWVKNQRKLDNPGYREGKVFLERKERLKAVDGWVWKAKKQTRKN
jgi:superfamily II DNA or RNA helicase